MPTNNVTATEVADPVEARLREHLPAWLAQDAFGDLDVPKEWLRVPATAAVTAPALPALAIIVDGLATQEPTWNRDRGYTAVWDVTIAVYVRGKDYAETRSRLERYLAAVRGCLLSAPDAIARRWKWVDEHYDTVSDRQAARTLGAGYFAITSEVAGAVVPRHLTSDPAATPGRFVRSEVSVRPRGFVQDLTQTYPDVPVVVPVINP
jgi:hypothetical protein